MRTMGLDVGSVTVGVAISDALGWTAQGIETITINEQAKQFGYDRVKELAEQNEVTKIVVGLPKNMNNTIGERAEASQKYAEVLESRTGIPVVLWDERLTTAAAERTLLEADVSRKKRKKVIDKLAAVMILQSYLDANN
ncbi:MULTISPECIES: Holliday junction resolvase RuvX [Listeria]|uniref:Putative pre-16S rRNA nuclease n=2 Tax=Listeria TaxID=1637 RepID=A0A099WBI2_9LIST|nr:MULTISPECIES: Holliday junction resolvase RuvX [Listeria]EUJ46247.1 Holliday junction resolvase-like protein [Listeria riparia FSL S10-1204]KGL41440.1 Holliday junction resolvase [Listeria booriae]MBC1211657.1 Holliday junction resolvase RuvX [Listeria booriae]MBC1226599.1 Holliday junction resolvase RuvX [Listeria booriae]MBC1230037.1 Holliday junction resolvase RuvX [Listeria booriae]